MCFLRFSKFKLYLQFKNRFKMKLRLIICSLLIALGLFACRRPNPPEPLICTADGGHKVLDTIRMENCSKKFTTQRWILPDGSPSTLPNVYYVPQAAGSYTFQLFVSDNDFVNEYKAIYTVEVNP